MEDLFSLPSAQAAATASHPEALKLLHASLAYNRVMEKRVAVLEHQLRAIGRERAAVNIQHGAPSPGPMGGAGGSDVGRGGEAATVPEAVSHAALIDEIAAYRLERKQLRRSLASHQQQLKLAEANLAHLAAKERTLVGTVRGLTRELNELRELLPPQVQAQAFTIDGARASAAEQLVVTDPDPLACGGAAAAAAASSADQEHSGSLDELLASAAVKAAAEHGEVPPRASSLTVTAKANESVDGDAHDTTTAALLRALGAAECVGSCAGVAQDSVEVGLPPAVQHQQQIFTMLQRAFSHANRVMLDDDDEQIAALARRIPSLMSARVGATAARAALDRNTFVSGALAEHLGALLSEAHAALKATYQSTTKYQAAQRSGLTLLLEMQSLGDSRKLPSAMAARATLLSAELKALLAAVANEKQRVGMVLVPSIELLVREWLLLLCGVAMYHRPGVAQLPPLAHSLAAHAVHLEQFSARLLDLSTPAAAAAAADAEVDQLLAAAAESGAAPVLSLAQLKALSHANVEISKRLAPLSDGCELLALLKSRSAAVQRIVVGSGGGGGGGGGEAAPNAVANCKATQVNFERVMSETELKLRQMASTSARDAFRDGIRERMLSNSVRLAGHAPSIPRQRSEQRRMGGGGGHSNDDEEEEEEEEEEEQVGVGEGDGGLAGEAHAAALIPPLHRGVHEHDGRCAAAEHVERMVGEARAAGLPFPPNFARDPKRRDIARFYFGTRKVVLEVAGNDVVTRVGGGYITLQELCGRHAVLETLKLHNATVAEMRRAEAEVGRGDAAQAPSARRSTGFMPLDAFMTAVERQKGARNSQVASPRKVTPGRR